MKKINKANLAGIVFALCFIAAFCIFSFTNSGRSTSDKRIIFIAGDNNAEPIIRATDLLYKHHPELSKHIDVVIHSPSNTREKDVEMPASDIIVLSGLDAENFRRHKPYFIKLRDGQIPASQSPSAKIWVGKTGVGVDKEIGEMEIPKDNEADAYWGNNAPEDLEQMMVYLLNRYAGYKDLKVEKPAKKLEQGFLVFKDNKPYKLVGSYAEWAAITNPDTSKPYAGYLISATAARAGILNTQAAIHKRLMEAGTQPVYIFGYPGSKMINDLVFTNNLFKKIKVVISEEFKFADKDAVAVLSKWNIPILNTIDIYGPTIAEWKQSTKGLSSQEITWQIAVPELSGVAAITVTGGIKMEGQMATKQPIPDRVNRVVERALRYIYLEKTPASKRKIAILYWNYPPGKDNVGASYLNVTRSITKVLSHLKNEGYDVSGFNDADSRSIEKLIMQRGRNVGRYAPGELQKMANMPDVVTVPVSTYKKWFSGLPKEYQYQLTNHWGQPEKADIMTIQKKGELHFVLPIIRFGNVSIMPQPDRARSQDLAALFHSQTLPPHHQYLCEYLWLQHNVDALIHTGTHGTQEWLDGKETGMSNTDSPEAMAGDLPIMYIYIMDDVGEGITAKRRGAATIIDHLTPVLVRNGITPELQKLKNLSKQFEETKALNPDGATLIKKEIESMMQKTGITKDLSKHDGARTKSNKEDFEETLHELAEYIGSIEKVATPFGLHTFGVSPQGKELISFTDVITNGNDKAKRDKYQASLVASGNEELRQLTVGLNAHYVTPNIGNDPILNPTALPTGYNFYTFDPRTIPIPYSDSIGKKLAKEYVSDFLAKNKKYPSKVALEVWGTETIRHQGMQEAQGMAMMGVRATRDEKGRVKKLELISRKELGRPRIDVVFSTTALYRDNFPMLIDVLDEAVQLAASSPEPDNTIRNNAEKLYKQLVAGGMDSAEARKRSLVRVFAEPAGTYSSKMSEAAYASGSWDKEEQVAALYIRRMGNGYGGGIWGESMETEFKASLSGVETIIHTDASNTYATLDNDDFFQFAGAIALGVRYVDKTKKSPDFLVSNLRVKGEEKNESLERFMGVELRSRYFNPEYIKAMEKEGYEGARHVMKGVEYMWGWQVMLPEVINAEKWQEFYEVWLKDRYNLKTAEFFEEHSPHAKESISGRMMEAVRKGYWTPTEEVKKDLAKMYAETVAKHGVSCGHNTCDNPELQQYIKGIAETNSNIPASAITKWIKNVETATKTSLPDALAKRIKDRADFADPSKVIAYKPNQTPVDKNALKPTNQTEKVKGYVMKEEKTVEASNASPGAKHTRLLYIIGIGLQVLVLLFGGISRSRNKAFINQKKQTIKKQQKEIV